MKNSTSKKLGKDKTLSLISIIICCLIILCSVLALIPPCYPGVSGTTFRFFTTLSNLLMSVTALISIPFYILFIKGKMKLPKWLQVLKLVATGCVFLTFLVAICFIWPVAGYDKAFGNMHRIIFHIVEPVLAVLLFVFIDVQVKISWKTMFFVLIPVLSYGVVYLVCNLCGIWVNAEGQMTDHYWLIKYPYMFAVLFVVCLLETWLLWWLNKLMNRVLIGYEIPVENEPKKLVEKDYKDGARTYHISKQSLTSKKWQVKLANGEKAIKLFNTQLEAIDFAKELVKTNGGSIRVHSVKGKIRKE